MALIDPASRAIQLRESQRRRIEELRRNQFFQFAAADACFACGCESFETVAERDRYGLPLNYVMCSRCGYVFANPYYTNECLADFYTEHYATMYSRTVSGRGSFAGAYLNARDYILPIIERHRSDAQSILDFGCGYGGSLAAFPQSWRRVGYDFDGAHLEFGRRLGFDLRSISALERDGKKYDVVMMNQVLEHLRDPVEALRAVAKMLAPRGIAYIEVPGIRSEKMHNDDLRLAFKNAHRHMFSLDSLTRVGDRAGLCLVKGDEHIRAVFRISSEELGTSGTLQAPSAITTRALFSEYAIQGPPTKANSMQGRLITFVQKIRRRARITWLWCQLESRALLHRGVWQ